MYETSGSSNCNAGLAYCHWGGRAAAMGACLVQTNYGTKVKQLILKLYLLYV
jgi:hypothetical protein